MYWCVIQDSNLLSLLGRQKCWPLNINDALAPPTGIEPVSRRSKRLVLSVERKGCGSVSENRTLYHLLERQGTQPYVSYAMYVWVWTPRVRPLSGHLRQTHVFAYTLRSHGRRAVTPRSRSVARGGHIPRRECPTPDQLSVPTPTTIHSVGARLAASAALLPILPYDSSPMVCA